MLFITRRLSENIPTSKYTFTTFFDKPKNSAPSYKEVSYLYFNGKGISYVV